jgi:Cobalamin-independent synthase, Catalytic domain
VSDEQNNPGFPWAQGSATGIGSMPGTDPAEATRVVVGDLPDFPFLPELPDRGPGADVVGRTAGLLIDIPVEVTPRGWRLAERPGRDLARARSMLASDLDVLAEVLEGYQGLVKIQLCGPWTLAAALELPRTMNVAVADPGAVADLTASLAEGAAAYVAEVLKRVPGAKLVVQLDEPSLPAVAEGEVPTQSGLSRLAAVETDTLRDGLAEVLASIRGYTVVHCCATTVPFGIIRAAGTNAVSFDLSQLRRGEEDAVAEAAEAGMGLLTGAVATIPDGVAGPGRGAETGRGERSSRGDRSGRGDRARGQGDEARERDEARETAERVIRFWRRLGLPLATLAEQAVITPACGLPGTSMAQARDVLTRCREAASMLPELIEETGGESR